MAILVTGASGFLGTALVSKLLAKGHSVYGLSRHPPEARDNLISLKGDILEPNLGLSEVPEAIRAVHHLAAIHRLGENGKEEIWKTNVLGTKEVIDFCTKYDIPHLYFTSTAYTQGRNTYERSKALCEWMIKQSHIAKVTIFKPSIVMGTPQHFYPGHFSQFIKLLIKVHPKADLVRRKIEGTLRLPIIEPVFRLKANPGAKLNLVSIATVVDAMAKIEEPGTYWLTHPDAPTLSQLVEWVGEDILLKIKIEYEFKPQPFEIMFEKMSTAFTPYLWGDDFPSDLKKCLPITREFITSTIKRSLLT
ncbi:ADP-L-glycero-D-manno-heptose-6-epimerase [subsurface metagenome]